PGPAHASLPFAALRPNPANRPRLTAAAFARDGLVDEPRLQLAAAGPFTFAHLPGASDPAYLGESPEVRLTPAIRAKAAELGHDPVAIYEWVRNHVTWLPTWGAMQEAELTLATRRGNALDVASLLIALLRASGIPARYVHGTLEVAAARFQAWAGGFATPEAALHFAASGGIPIEGVVRGGRLAAVRMEHVWVEAAIDYLPSRGAVNRDADSWIALDASFKEVERLPGLDAAAIAGLDPAALAQAFAASGQVNAQEGWATGFDPAILEGAQAQAQAALEAYLAAHLPQATVGEVVGGTRIVPSHAPFLPSTLPNPVVAVGGRYAALPEALEHRVTFSLGAGSDGQGAAVTLPWARVNNQKITLAFKPATAADEEALRSLLPAGPITDPAQLPTSIPAYLVHVIPELAVEGTVVLQGRPMGLGETLPFGFRIEMPGQSLVKQATSPVVAGSYLAVAAVGGSVSPARLRTLQDRLAATRDTLAAGDPGAAAGLGRERLLGDLFYAGTLGYFAEYTALAQVMS
ncbi:MAG: transglutaminase domain-containing protein, partial [Nitrospirae bacterium]